MKFLDKIVKSKKNIILFLAVVAIISSFTLIVIPNISRGHDLAFHLSRISAIKDNLKLGIIGGYIYPNYLGGYGYGNPLFYPDIFLYIPAILSYFGLSVINSYKIFLLMISFFSILSMYICVKGISDNKKSAIISSIVYGFASYRLVDLFTRAALGESLAFIFAPLVIYGIYEIIYGNQKKYYFLIIGMSGLILSHLISTYLMGILLVMMCIINIKRFFQEKSRIFSLIKAAIITFLLTGFYLLPMLEQMLDGQFLFNNLNETSKLLERSLPIWSIFIEFPYHVFRELWIPTGLGISFMIIVYYFIKSYKQTSNFVRFCIISGLILLICSTNLFPWDICQSILSPIQFPWRFYFLVVLMLSIGAGLLFKEIKSNSDKIFNKILLFSIIPVLVVGILNFSEQNINEVGVYEISFGEYMPSTASKDYIVNRGDVITTNYPLVHNFERNGLRLEIEFSDNEQNNSLELPLLYYKGYRAIINGQVIDTYRTTNGLVGLDINNIESGTITVYYAGTTIQYLTRLISFVTIFSIMLITFIKKRGEKSEK
ncbi:MAG: hypothetical protein E7165_04505 [Firmicutes bacterium]|nr:hypothetical protein [Bacillota bacterium]